MEPLRINRAAPVDPSQGLHKRDPAAERRVERKTGQQQQEPERQQEEDPPEPEVEEEEKHALDTRV